MFSWLTNNSCSSELGAAEKPFPGPAVDTVLEKQQTRAKAVFAGGCFWCTEAVCERVVGVKNVVSGYAGDSEANADYRKVSSGTTNHAESIEITYDPRKISYGQLLKVFFAAAHDPTQLNKQGPDWGRQYRSAIFYTTDEQREVAEAYIRQLDASGIFGKKIVTTVEKLDKFYPAESYHQDFARNNPSQGYVVVNALPKVEKLKKNLPDLVADKARK
ncbi:MAG: peptide-methionine (S)-S-oxide reductase MsrA [Bryobacterales bacterium]|nr:peptide-methionine (S)-S-oxide reductase MsrA [Bryobacterales bacterium]